MAEFQEVMRQFNRMCDTCNNCECGLSNVGSVESCYGKLVSLPVESEKAIMAWAAEHPEPVYPTWVEWMKSMGVIPYMMGLVTVREEDGTFCDGHVNITEKALKPIPADIAEKLGLKPKE